MSDLFTIVTVPAFASENVQNLIQWFRAGPATRHKLLLDNQCLTQNFTLEQVHTLYPEIKTVGLVTDPWNRLVRAFLKLRLNHIMAFDDFINRLDEYPIVRVPQIKYLQYELNGSIIKADFIFKNEYLQDEFKTLQQYTGSNVPLEIAVEPKTEIYKKFYSPKTREIVEKVFEEDILAFSYKFS